MTKIVSSKKNRMIRMGIIGTGSRGVSVFGKELVSRPDVNLVALCDPNPVRMKSAKMDLRCSANLYVTVDEMIAKESMDAVVITSPDWCHESNAVAALKGGLHVLIDKPLATTVVGCDHIIRMAKKTKKIAMVGFNLRHHAVLKRLKKIIDAGVLGKIFLLENREFYDGGRTYMSRWNRFYEKSGGLWIHKGSHDFDVFNWLLNFPKPIKVSAFAGVDVFTQKSIPFKLQKGIPVGPSCHKCFYRFSCPDRYDLGETLNGLWSSSAEAFDGYSKDLCIYTSRKDTHDNGISIVEYENGVKASHLECFVTSQTDRLYTVVGDRGQAEVSLQTRSITVRPRWKGEVVTYHIAEEAGGHGGADPILIKTFLDVVSGRIHYSSTLEHGRWATAIGQAAELSSREGRMVYIREIG